MKFSIMDIETGKEWKGTKDCGNLLDVTDKIQELVTDYEENVGGCLDQGGADDWYEFTAADPITSKQAKDFLKKCEETFFNRAK